MTNASLRDNFDIELRMLERRKSAISGLFAVRIPNDWTEVTLPDAETDDRNRPGPKLPVVLVAANVGFGSSTSISRSSALPRPL